jgi:hypothetical protein
MIELGLSEILENDSPIETISVSADGPVVLKMPLKLSQVGDQILSRIVLNEPPQGSNRSDVVSGKLRSFLEECLKISSGGHEATLDIINKNKKIILSRNCPSGVAATVAAILAPDAPAPSIILAEKQRG